MAAWMDKMIDDLWIDVFGFCSVVDFLHIRESCKTFFKITNKKNARINDYWESRCKQLCSSIDSTYETKKWYDMYWELIYLLYHHGYIDKTDDKTHDIIIPKICRELLTIIVQILMMMMVSTIHGANLEMTFQYFYSFVFGDVQIYWI